MSPSNLHSQQLTKRERDILRLVVKSFIDTAGPVGSRFLARNHRLGISPASIRNTMSDLEDAGFLDHPYTSAGRVPTELGYRTFVDQLIDHPGLTPKEKKSLQRQLGKFHDTRRLLDESSRLVSTLTNLLGVVISPQMSKGELERLEVVQISSSTVMFIVSVKGGLVRTIILPVETELDRNELEHVVRLLNERLAGLTLDEIRKSCRERVKGLDDTSGIVEMVVEQSKELFTEHSEMERLSLSGIQYIIAQPEFREPADIRRLMELVENREAVLNVLEHRFGDAEPAQASVSIGSEHGEKDEEMTTYSIVAAQYKLGDSTGTIGVIGPTRMDYTRAIALVEGMAALLNQEDQGGRS